VAERPWKFESSRPHQVLGSPAAVRSRSSNLASTLLAQRRAASACSGGLIAGTTFEPTSPSRDLPIPVGPGSNQPHEIRRFTATNRPACSTARLRRSDRRKRDSRPPGDVNFRRSGRCVLHEPAARPKFPDARPCAAQTNPVPVEIFVPRTGFGTIGKQCALQLSVIADASHDSGRRVRAPHLLRRNPSRLVLRRTTSRGGEVARRLRSNPPEKLRRDFRVKPAAR